MTENSPLVLFCGGGSGGHLTPGLAVADALLAAADPPEVLFLTGDRPAERRMMAAGRYPHRAFPLAPPGRTLRSWRAAAAFAAAFRFARRSANGRPAVVVGTGGYASVPGVLGAKSAGAGALLIEPNAADGRATRWLGPLADRVLVHEEDGRGGTRVPVGVPVRAAAAEARVAPRTLLVLGGSQGAASLDAAVPAAVAAAADDLRGWQIAHQCGTDAAAVRGTYAAAGVRAEVAPFFPDAAARLATAAFAVTRGGAVTLAEAARFGVPLAVVPHPAVPGDHQRANAGRHVRASGGTALDDGPDLAARLAVALRTLPDRPTDPVRANRERPGESAADRAASLIRDALSRRAGRRG